jgi:hypothetical protein
MGRSVPHMTTEPPATTTAPDYPRLLVEQLTWHWDNHLRPRLDGLTDEEYRWEPAEGSWSVRPRGTGTAPVQAGAGDHTIDFAVPEPEPPPLTTIAWRIGHLVVGVLGERAASHFAGPPTSYTDHTYAATAEEALAQLDATYEAWRTGVAALGEDGMARPCGPAEGPWHAAPMAALVLHISREVIHHGAEVLLLRDLYRATDGGRRVLPSGAGSGS